MSDLQAYRSTCPTNTPPSSTVFACVRASSLGLAVSDLSWAYCWAAIWGDIELGFGILGAVRSSHPIPIPSTLKPTLTLNQNLALSRTYYDFFKRTLDTLTSKTRSHPTYPTHPHYTDPNGPSAPHSYALHSLPKSKKSLSRSRNHHSAHKSNASNPLSSATLTHNSSASPTWDGSHANKSSRVQIHHARRSSSGATSEGSDEIPLQGSREKEREKERDAWGGGIERKIEFSVEEDVTSGGGIGEGDAGWGRDLEREGSRVGEEREVGIGRGI